MGRYGDDVVYLTGSVRLFQESGRSLAATLSVELQQNSGRMLIHLGLDAIPTPARINGSVWCGRVTSKPKTPQPHDGVI